MYCIDTTLHHLSCFKVLIGHLNGVLADGKLQTLITQSGIECKRDAGDVQVRCRQGNSSSGQQQRFDPEIQDRKEGV
jgi:hypothetical protein